MHWIKRFFSVLLILVILGVVGLFIVQWKYSERLKESALETLKTYITTEVTHHPDVQVSLWQDFPMISVRINDLTIADALIRSDTLIHATRAFVQFDVLRILQNDISIAGIRLSDGSVNVRHSSTDEWNYNVWRKNTDTVTSQPFSLKIEILTLQNMDVRYEDEMLELEIRFHSDRSKLKGSFHGSDQQLGVNLTGILHHLASRGTQRIVDLPLELTGILELKGSERRYTMPTGNALLAGNEIVFNTEWKMDQQDVLQMALEVHAGNIRPHTLLPLLWPQMPQNIRQLQLQGVADVVLNMQGPFTATRGPKLDAAIEWRDGSLLFRGLNVRDLKFETELKMADLRRSDAIQLHFQRFELETPKGKVTGSGELTNLQNPYLKLHSNGSSRLEEILQVADVQEFSGAGGVGWELDLEGPLGMDFITTTDELKRMQWNGRVDLQSISLKTNGSIPPIEKLNGHIELNGPKTRFVDCNTRIGHVDVKGDGELKDLKQLLTDPEYPVALKANLALNEVDIPKLTEEWEFSSETDADRPQRNTDVQVMLSVKRLTNHAFSASDIHTKMTLRNDELKLEHMTVKALGGSLHGDLTYRPQGNGTVLMLNVAMQDVDMERTLKEWDDMGQTTLTHKNLKGRASATMNAEISMDTEHRILRDNMKMEADVEISGGELIDFEPLQALSRFISVDELLHVRFDTLRNHLTINNGKLSIPRMTVSSSILNVDVFGSHSFDQELDYHVNLLLTELLRRKSKQQRSFEGHEILDDRGKTRLFLWVRGRPGDLKVGFDKREVKQKLKQDLKKESQTLKQLFKEEFGKRDQPPQQEEESPVQFELEETPNPKESVAAPDPPKEKRKRKKRGLFAPDPEEEETEGDFEIEFEP